MNFPQPPDAGPTHPAAPIPVPATPASLKIVVNGRTVVQRHFLQQTMDAMVRRALADEPALHPR